MGVWRRIRERFGRRQPQLQFKSMPPPEPGEPDLGGFWSPPPEPEPEEDEGELGAYARKSPPKSRDVIDGQFDQLELEFGGRVSERFADDGVSGKVHWTKRPGLSALLYAIKDGRLRGICFVSLDRLCRPEDVLEQEKILSEVWEHGGRVFSLREGELLPDGPADHSRKLVRLGIANFNQQWRLENAERRQRGRQRQLRKGCYNGGRPLERKTGYRLTRFYDPSRRTVRLTWEPTEQIGAVWRIKELFAERGRRWQSIADTLNEEGWPTVKGGPWNRCTVLKVALRPEQVVRDGSQVLELPAKRVERPAGKRRSA